MWYAPQAGQPGESRSFEPDLLVIRREDVTPQRLTGTPLLLVEVTSPSTARIDRTATFDAYAEAAVAQYWIVDPGSGEREVSIAVYDLALGTDVLQGRASGGAELAIDGPVPVTVTPAALIG